MICCERQKEKEEITGLTQAEQKQLFLEQQEQKLNQFENSELYQKALKKERNCLTQCGLELENEIEVKNIRIKLQDETKEFIHTYHCGKENKENLVLLHGYAGSSMTYVKCLKNLSKKYNVYAIDFLGIGLSSRPKFEITDPQEIIDYFIHSIEEWRKNVGIKGKFTLAGHSFGGYIGTFYGLEHSHLINRLLLLSPVGGTKRTQQQIEEIEDNIRQNSNWFRRWLFLGKLKSFYQEKTGPTRLLNKWYIPAQYGIKRYFSRRVGLPDNEVRQWVEYMDLVFKLPESTEVGFFDLFAFPLSAKIALEEKLHIFKEKKIDVHLYYGKVDWMDSKGTRKLFNNNQIQGSYNIIDNAGHQLVFENPESLTEQMTRFVQ